MKIVSANLLPALIFLFALLSSIPSVFSETSAPSVLILEELKSLQKKIESLKIAVGELENEGLAWRTEQLEEKRQGLKISGSLTAIVQSSVNRRANNSVQSSGGNPPGPPNRAGQITNDKTIGAGSLDLYLEADILQNITVFARLQANSANQPFSPSIALPNGDGYFPTHLAPQNLDVLNLLEIYAEGKWYNNQLTVTVGKIDLTNYFDGNTIAWDEHAQFVSANFTNNPSLYSALPFDTIGARASLDLGAGFTVQAAAVSNNNSGDKLFNEMFGILEVDYTTNFFRGLEGNYRAYGYVKDINDFDEFGNALPGSSDPLGFGISADQKITERFTVFSRFGANQGGLAESLNTIDGIFPAVSSSISAGAQYEGLLPNRPKDFLGGAWALNDPSDPVRVGIAERPDDEYFMEFYYSYEISPVFHVSPTLQFIKHPNGDDDENWTTVLGGRAFLEF